MALCTDDCGVFDTSLSREFAIAAGAFSLSKDELYALARGAVEFAFATSSQHAQIHQVFSKFQRQLT